MTLRVVLQIIPFGDEDKAYEIDRLDISNFGSGEDSGFYKYQAKYRESTKEEYLPFVVKHFRDNGAWELVRLVLNKWKK